MKLIPTHPDELGDCHKVLESIIDQNYIVRVIKYSGKTLEYLWQLELYEAPYNLGGLDSFCKETGALELKKNVFYDNLEEALKELVEVIKTKGQSL